MREDIKILQNWSYKIENLNTDSLFIGQETKDIDNSVCKIIDKTPNSVCVFIKKKPKLVDKKSKKAVIDVDSKTKDLYKDELDEDEFKDKISRGIDSNQWFTVSDFYKRFKI